MLKDPNIIIPLDMSVKSHVELITIAKAASMAVEFQADVEILVERRVKLLKLARRVLEELQLVAPRAPLSRGHYELETHTKASSVILSLVCFQIIEVAFLAKDNYVFQFECPPLA